MLVVVCAFSYIILAIITVCISDLQALDGLLVLYDEYKERELEKIHDTPIVVLDNLYILDLRTFLHACHVQTNPQILLFLCMKCFFIELNQTQI